MTLNQKQAAKEFVERWKAEEGDEIKQSRSFWIELASKVLGINDPTYVLEFERKVQGRLVDVFYEDMGILIEQKSRGIDLDKKSERSKQAGEETPYQQAKWYADHLPNSIRPDWIIVSNFDEFRIHNLDSADPNHDPEHDYVSFTLDELPDQLHLLKMFTDKSSSRLVKEKELSVKAGELVGRLYQALAAQYQNIKTDKNEQRSLNILIVRFVFLLYAEDADILQEHQAFLNYMAHVAPEDMRSALIQLFEVLDTPEDQRDPYLPEKLSAFPYVNGSLFAEEDIVVPQFTQSLKDELLSKASEEFNWSGISPTIFGAVFESTLNPETRREGGMHYTSLENIHKVIDPLFLDDLKAELAKIEGEKVVKQRTLKLRQFQEKLASIKVLDPACGSGNFLTESYLSLRKLENRVLESLMGEQMGLAFTGSDVDPIKVSIDQFYGIEINDFAVAVAKTALWIAEEQMMDVTQDILLMPLHFLPLTTNNNIHEGNALRMDWNDILPAEKCNYIIGNPPFVGYSNHSREQQADRELLFGKNCKVLDYVAGWYKRAADYMGRFPIHAAFVSTNSITQGQQVEPLWKPLFESGLQIDFAWTTFVWNSEAKDQAHVHVVIIGFSRAGTRHKRLFTNGGVRKVTHINGYLAPAADVFIARRGKPIQGVKPLVCGCKPTDDGNLILSPEEKEGLIKQEPQAKKWIRPFSMGAEFINGKDRYCLWLVDANPEDLHAMPHVMQRVEKVREMRLKSHKAATNKKAATPWLFDEVHPPKGESYLAIPVVSSGRRAYIPIDFVTNGMIPGDKLFFMSDAGLYEFGILMSQFHNAWMRVVAGRLKSDYSYSNTIVYNNFIYPNPTKKEQQAIERAAQAVLDARELSRESSFADLYDPDKMPQDLLEAHKALDKAVEEAYDVNFDGDEEKIVSHLFKLYAEATKDE